MLNLGYEQYPEMMKLTSVSRASGSLFPQIGARFGARSWFDGGKNAVIPIQSLRTGVDLSLIGVSVIVSVGIVHRTSVRGPHLVPRSGELMPHLSAIEADQDRTQPVVELRIRASLDQLSILRALAATVAIQENFDLDSIADIRLAMDEICTHLIVRALPDSVLVCRFVYTAPQLHVSVSTTTANYDGSDQRSFGWHVLTALTDSISVDQEENPNRAGYITTMKFTKAKFTTAEGRHQ